VSLMPAVRMHDDELEIDDALVGRLLAGQFPEWADLPLEPVLPAGTDNALYRLGDDMVVRLPRIHWAVGHVVKEQKWLPRLAPLLPLAIPVVLAKGAPGEEYPWQWSVYRWLEGENLTGEHIVDPGSLAIELAAFISALQRIDPTGAPAGRGVPLEERDAATRAAIDKLDGAIDTEAMTEVWETALHAPVWHGSPVWTHGDLDSRNLLAEDGRLAAVLDFGCVGVSDPACDVMAAWKVCSAETRAVFRAALSVDDATWARSRGWALSQALMALSYYTLETNAVLVLEARRWLAEVLAD
jgi:aminoglycoside phosphotransferase (APT) family kinase protein